MKQKDGKLTVILIYKVFNHYRRPIFDELSKRINFILLHSRNDKWVRSENTEYSIEVPSFRYGKKPTQVWLFVIRELISMKPKVIIHEFTPSLISLHITYLYAKIFGKKFIIYGHGYNQSIRFNRKSLSFRIRLFYLRHSDAILLYAQKDKLFLKKFVNPKKIFVAQNTLDTNRLSHIRDKYEMIGKSKIKEELGYTNQYNIIYIGRLLPDKKPDTLIDIGIMLKKASVDVGFYFIGGGKMKDNLIEKVKLLGLDNFHFVGEVYDDEVSGKYLYCSDLMIMPGYLGLSVNHSLCFDCPVVSFEQGPNGPFHSPEVEYIINNKTGYLAKNNSLSDLVNWVLKYFNDCNLQKVMKDEIRNSVEFVFSKDKMVNGFLDALEYVQK